MLNQNGALATQSVGNADLVSLAVKLKALGFNISYPGNAAESAGGTSGNDLLVGSHEDDDQFDGLGGNDIIAGGGGNDTLDGDGGNDIIAGGTGDDMIDGGRGVDVLTGAGGADTINGGDGRDLIFGGSGADVISGGAKDDIIRAGGGDDIITGGTGNDVMTGKSGADTFIFNDGDGVDVIQDFDSEEGDLIALAISGISDFDDVLDNATDVDGGVFLNFGDGNGVLLSNVSADELSADDFLFA